MTRSIRFIRVCLAAVVAVLLALALPIGQLFASVAIAAFVVFCFLLGVPSLVTTAGFLLIVAATPLILFAIGAASAAPLPEAIRLSAQGFGSHPNLVLWFVAVPAVVASAAYYVLLIVGARRA